MRIDELTIWNFDLCKSITGNNYDNDNILSLRVWSISFQITLLKWLPKFKSLHYFLLNLMSMRVI